MNNVIKLVKIVSSETRISFHRTADTMDRGLSAKRIIMEVLRMARIAERSVSKLVLPISMVLVEPVLIVF